MRRATAHGMAIEAAITCRHAIQHRLPVGMFFVIHNGPCPLQRRRSQIVRIAAHCIAGGIADAAIDAFDSRVGMHSPCGIRSDAFNRVLTCLAGFMPSANLDPFFEKRIHIRRQVLDYRQVVQRCDFKLVVLQHFLDMGAAGPARRSVHHHRARPTHPHAAGKPVAQGWIDVLLNPRDNIQDRLIIFGRNLEGFVPAALGSPLQTETAISFCLTDKLDPRGS